MTGFRTFGQRAVFLGQHLVAPGFHVPPADEAVEQRGVPVGEVTNF